MTVRNTLDSRLMFNNANVDGQIVRESIIAGTISASVLAVNYYGGSRIITVSSPASNFTVNLTNPPVDNNETINLNIVVTQGATGRLASAFSINGVGQTLRWVGGVTPTPTNNKIDIFSFTIIRQSDAWTVLGQASLNF